MTYSFPDLRSRPPLVAAIISLLLLPLSPTAGMAQSLPVDGETAVVYYGSSPPTKALSSIRGPVLGLYGGADNRVNSTIPAAQAELQRLGKRYDVNIYDGAGHSFLGRQNGQDGANQAAAEGAWPATISFFRELLEQ